MTGGRSRAGTLLALAGAAALALACGIKAAPRPPLPSKPGGKAAAPAAEPSTGSSPCDRGDCASPEEHP